MKTSYTRKEFEDKYNSPAIKDFFKHIDRKTIEPDFFQFYGISKSMLKSENNHTYSIPIEAAPLLATMIQSFQYAYGADRRGHSRDDTIPLSYEKYHDYIEELQRQIKQLEPYQQALIKNYRSYTYTQVIDTFMPFLVERISVLLLMMFSYSGDLIDEVLIRGIRAFDTMIEGLAKLQLEQNNTIPSRLLYTFDDAVSKVFQILTGAKKDSSNLEQVHLVDFEKMIIKEKEEFERNSIIDLDNENGQEAVTRHLNQKYEEYFLTHQDVNKLYDENFNYELLLTQKRWTATSQMELEGLRLLPRIRRAVRRCIQMRNGLGDFQGFEERFNGKLYNLLDADAFEELSPDDREAYCYCKYTIHNYKVDFPEGTKEYRDFVEKKIKEFIKLKIKGGEIQSDLHEDPWRMRTVDIYNREKHSNHFKIVQEALGEAITELLTKELAKKEGEGQG